MENQNAKNNIINSNELVLCPNCNCNFPQIHKLLIKNNQFKVSITCDNCSELHNRKLYNIETLLTTNNNNNSTQHKCWLCDNTNETIKKLFCITCEKWICNDCMKYHDEYIVNDIHSYVDTSKHVHTFCEREVYFKHKCCIHHNIKPIDRKLETVIASGNFRSIVVENNNNVNDDDDSVQSSSHNTPGKPTYAKQATHNNNYHHYYPTLNDTNRSKTVMNDVNNNNNNKNSILPTKPRNDTSSASTCTSTTPTGNVIYDHNGNIIANDEGNVYADKYCLECNLFFCESCAIDHEHIMSHHFDNDIAYNLETHNNDLNGIIQKKEEFITTLLNEINKLKQQSSLSLSSSSLKDASTIFTESELNNIDKTFQLNTLHHNNYVSLLIKISNLYHIMKLHNIFNLNIINSYLNLTKTNDINNLRNDIQKEKKNFQTLNIFLLTRFYFKIEHINCFKEYTIDHNGVTSMIFFKKRLYTGGKRMLKKWMLHSTKHLSSTLLQTKDGRLTGRINCFCKVSDTMIIAGSDRGNILLCEFGEHSGIRITTTDRKQPILCMQLLTNDSNHVTSFLLSDTKGIWEISIESRNGRTMLSEVEFFKTKDENGKNVPVRALITAKGTNSCFLLGGLDYIYPKFRGNTLIKIQDSIKCSERNENKLISCMTYVEGTSILVVGSYDCCVGALVLNNPQQKSKYKVITCFDSGVVSVVSTKDNEVIALSSCGTFQVINISMCYGDTGFKWEVIALFHASNLPAISLVSLQEGYFAICGCDKIEIWYAHI